MKRQTALAGVVGCVLLAAPVSASTSPQPASAPAPGAVVADSALVATAPAELAQDPVVVPAARSARDWVGQAGDAASAEQVPTIVLDAYTTAVAVAPARCKITVPLLAAVGQVESGNLVGRALDASHAVTPAIVGPRLDGGAFRSVGDTDGGRLDGDKKFDRAVGPMQFLPSTWRSVGVDMDGDGERDPQNVYDAAGAAMVYLCGTRDLSDPAQLRTAILGYNRSAAYVQQVLTWKSTFETKGLGATASLPIFSASNAGSSLATTGSGATTGTPSGRPSAKPGRPATKPRKPGRPSPSTPGSPKPTTPTTPTTPGTPSPTDPTTPAEPGTPVPTDPGTPTTPPSGSPIPDYTAFPACDAVATPPVVELKPVTAGEYALGASWVDATLQQLLLTYDGSQVYAADICSTLVPTTSPSASPSLG